MCTVLYCCHRVSTQLQLTIYIYIYIYIYMNIYEYQHEYLRNTFVLVIGLTSRELAVNNKTERTIQY